MPEPTNGTTSVLGNQIIKPKTTSTSSDELEQLFQKQKAEVKAREAENKAKAEQRAANIIGLVKNSSLTQTNPDKAKAVSNEKYPVDPKDVLPDYNVLNAPVQQDNIQPTITPQPDNIDVPVKVQQEQVPGYGANILNSIGGNVKPINYAEPLDIVDINNWSPGDINTAYTEFGFGNLMDEKEIENSFIKPEINVREKSEQVNKTVRDYSKSFISQDYIKLIEQKNKLIKDTEQLGSLFLKDQENLKKTPEFISYNTSKAKVSEYESKLSELEKNPLVSSVIKSDALFTKQNELVSKFNSSFTEEYNQLKQKLELLEKENAELVDGKLSFVSTEARDEYIKTQKQISDYYNENISPIHKELETIENSEEFKLAVKGIESPEYKEYLDGTKNYTETYNQLESAYINVSKLENELFESDSYYNYKNAQDQLKQIDQKLAAVTPSFFSVVRINEKYGVDGPTDEQFQNEIYSFLNSKRYEQLVSNGMAKPLPEGVPAELNDLLSSTLYMNSTVKVKAIYLGKAYEELVPQLNGLTKEAFFRTVSEHIYPQYDAMLLKSFAEDGLENVKQLRSKLEPFTNQHSGAQNVKYVNYANAITPEQQKSANEIKLLNISESLMREIVRMDYDKESSGWESLSRGLSMTKLVEWLPFASGVDKATYNNFVYKTINKFEKYGASEMSPAEMSVIEAKTMIDSYNSITKQDAIYGIAKDTFPMMTAFIGEMVLTSGLGSSASKATTTALNRTATIKAMKNYTLANGTKPLAPLSTGMVTAFATIASLSTKTTVGGVTQIQADVIRDMTKNLSHFHYDENLTAEIDKDFKPYGLAGAVLHAWTGRAIEVTTEASGALIGKAFNKMLNAGGVLTRLELMTLSKSLGISEDTVNALVRMYGMKNTRTFLSADFASMASMKKYLDIPNPFATLLNPKMYNSALMRSFAQKGGIQNFHVEMMEEYLATRLHHLNDGTTDPIYKNPFKVLKEETVHNLMAMTPLFGVGYIANVSANQYSRTVFNNRIERFEGLLKDIKDMDDNTFQSSISSLRSIIANMPTESTRKAFNGLITKRLSVDLGAEGFASFREYVDAFETDMAEIDSTLNMENGTFQDKDGNRVWLQPSTQEARDHVTMIESLAAEYVAKRQKRNIQPGKRETRKQRLRRVAQNRKLHSADQQVSFKEYYNEKMSDYANVLSDINMYLDGYSTLNLANAKKEVAKLSYLPQSNRLELESLLEDAVLKYENSKKLFQEQQGVNLLPTTAIIGVAGKNLKFVSDGNGKYFLSETINETETLDALKDTFDKADFTVKTKIANVMLATESLSEPAKDRVSQIFFDSIFSELEMLGDKENPEFARKLFGVLGALRKDNRTGFSTLVSNQQTNAPVSRMRADSVRAFGVPTENVEAVRSLYESVFANLKAAGIVSEPTVNEWLDVRGVGVSNTEALNQIIGEVGSKGLFRIENWLRNARMLEQLNSSSKEIWLKTGWERGSDGKWRYDLPEKNALDSFELGLEKDGLYGEEVSVSDFLDKNSQLLLAYPQLKEIKVIIDRKNKGVGSYNPTKKTIIINTKEYSSPFDKTKGMKQMHSTFIHELQHAIQHIEGFPFGTNGIAETAKVIIMYNEKLRKELLKNNKEYSELMDKAESLPVYENENSLVINKEREELDIKLEKIFKEYKDANPLDKKDLRKLAEEFYYGNKGEVEARNVQYRELLTEEERRSTRISKTEDVNEKSKLYISIFNQPLFQQANAQYHIESGKNIIEALRNFNNTDIINGFYSPLEKVINETKFDKLPAKQWIDKFAKGEEAKWTGLTDWLSQQQGSVSKADIQQYLKDNRIEIVEVVKSDRPFKQIKQAFESVGSDWEEVYGGVFAKLSDKSNEYERRYNLRINGTEYGRDFTYLDAKSYVEANAKTNPEKQRSRFSQHQLEGEKENYKEIMIVLPREGSMKKVGDYTVPSAHKYGEDLADNRRVVHLRMNTRTAADGSKVLFLEEVQSDWGQQGKKTGFKISEAEQRRRNYFPTDGVPQAPFVTDTNAWVKLAFKVALKEAVKQGADKIAWTTGEQQFERWGSEMISWSIAKPEIVGEKKIEINKPIVKKNITYSKDLGSYVVETKFRTKKGIDKSRKFFKTEEEANNYVKSWSMFTVNIQEQIGGTAFNGLNINDKSFSKDGVLVGTKIELKKAISETLQRERTDSEVDKLTDRIWSRMQTENTGTLLPRKEGMQGFYGSPTEGSIGIVGGVAEKLSSQKVLTVEIEVDQKEKRRGDINQYGIPFNAELFQDYINSFPNEKGREFIRKYDENFDTGLYPPKDFQSDMKSIGYDVEFDGDISRGFDLTILKIKKGNELIVLEDKVLKEAKIYNSTQHSIDITPELISQVYSGLPLFQQANAQYHIESGKNIIEALRNFNNTPEATVAIVHEIMHPTVVAIFDATKTGNAKGIKYANTIVEEYNKAFPNNKITLGAMLDDNDSFKTGVTTDNYRSVQEFIAESWEKYHKDGTSGFSNAFQKVLKQITEAFRAVYSSLTGQQISPELRKMFDEILDKQPKVLRRTNESKHDTSLMNLDQERKDKLNKLLIELFKINTREVTDDNLIHYYKIYNSLHKYADYISTETLEKIGNRIKSAFKSRGIQKVEQFELDEFDEFVLSEFSTLEEELNHRAVELSSPIRADEDIREVAIKTIENGFNAFWNELTDKQKTKFANEDAARADYAKVARMIEEIKLSGGVAEFVALSEKKRVDKEFNIATYLSVHGLAKKRKGITYDNLIEILDGEGRVDLDMFHELMSVWKAEYIKRNNQDSKVFKTKELKDLVRTPKRKSAFAYKKDLARVKKIVESAEYRSVLIDANKQRRLANIKLVNNYSKDIEFYKVYKVLTRINPYAFDTVEELEEYNRLLKQKSTYVDLDDYRERVKILNKVYLDDKKSYSETEANPLSEIMNDYEKANLNFLKDYITNTFNVTDKKLLEFLSIQTDNLDSSEVRKFKNGIAEIINRGSMSKESSDFLSNHKVKAVMDGFLENYDTRWIETINKKANRNFAADAVTMLGNISKFNLPQIVNMIDGFTEDYGGVLTNFLIEPLKKNHNYHRTTFANILNEFEVEGQMEKPQVQIVGIYATLNQKPTYRITKDDLEMLFDLGIDVSEVKIGEVFNTQHPNTEVYEILRKKDKLPLAESILLSMGIVPSKKFYDEIGVNMDEREYLDETKVQKALEDISLKSGKNKAAVKKERVALLKEIGAIGAEGLVAAIYNDQFQLAPELESYYKKLINTFKDVKNGKYTDGKTMAEISTQYTGKDFVEIEDYFPIVRYIDMDKINSEILEETANTQSLELAAGENVLNNDSYFANHQNLNPSDAFLKTRNRAIMAINLDSYEVLKSRLDQELFYMINEPSRIDIKNAMNHKFFSNTDKEIGLSPEAAFMVKAMFSNYFNRGVSVGRAALRADASIRKVKDAMNTLKIATLGAITNAPAQLSSSIMAMQEMQGNSVDKMTDLLWAAKLISTNWAMGSISEDAKITSEQIEDFLVDYAPEIAWRGVSDFDLPEYTEKMSMSRLYSSLQDDTYKRERGYANYIGNLVNNRALNLRIANEKQLLPLVYFDRAAARVSFFALYKNALTNKGAKFSLDNPDLEAIETALRGVRKTQNSDMPLYKPALLQGAIPNHRFFNPTSAMHELFHQSYWSFKSFAINEAATMAEKRQRAIEGFYNGDEVKFSDAIEAYVYNYIGKFCFQYMKVAMMPLLLYPTAMVYYGGDSEEAAEMTTAVMAYYGNLEKTLLNGVIDYTGTVEPIKYALSKITGASTYGKEEAVNADGVIGDMFKTTTDLFKAGIEGDGVRAFNPAIETSIMIGAMYRIGAIPGSAELIKISNYYKKIDELEKK
jgi:hypothetical protein